MVPAVVENPTGREETERPSVSQGHAAQRFPLWDLEPASVPGLIVSGVPPLHSHPMPPTRCSPCVVGLCRWGLGLEGCQVSLRFWVCHEKLKDDSLVLKNRKPFLARQSGFTPPAKQPRVGENPSLDHCGKPPDGSRRKPPLGHPRNNKHTS